MDAANEGTPLLGSDVSNPSEIKVDEEAKREDGSERRDYDSLKESVLRETVVPSFRREIADLVTSRFRWRKWAERTELCGKLLQVVGTVLAFAAVQYHPHVLGLLSGISNTLAMAMAHYATYAEGESQERTKQANVLLKSIGIDELPDELFLPSNNKNEV